MTERDPHRGHGDPAKSATPAPPASEARTQRSERASQPRLALAGEFPTATRERWRELVAAVLRKAGRDLDGGPDEVERLLAGTVGDGVSVAPLYTADDAVGDEAVGIPGLAPFTRGGRALGSSPDGWDVRARHADPDVALTRDEVAADLENGVTSLWLVLGEGALPVDALRAVLDEVYLDLAPIALDAGSHTRAAAEALFALAAEREVPGRALAGTLGADPLGLLAAADADADLDAGLRGAGELAARCARAWPNLRAVTVDVTAYHGAGADDAQELACSLAAGVAYLRALTAEGLTVPEALAQLEFRYAATADQFATVAKLRAARALWSRVSAECGHPAAQRQHAVSSEVMVTARDPWVNMLRTTLACFGAGVGGADAVTVLPFDAALGLPDQFSRRMARNTQSLLVAESHLARVVDPAGGSWYVESLTTALARRAWELFTEIERGGGLGTALRDGSLAERLATTWRARERRLATRTEPITGVSEFADPDEPALVRPLDPRPTGHGRLHRVRRATAFEALRDRALAHLVETARQPSVFLAALGSVAGHTARVSFASNLFRAAGLDTPMHAGSPDELAREFGTFRTTVACLCGADQTYADTAYEAARALRGAGATKVMLAGRPGTADAAVDGYVYAGCDAVGVLTRTLDELGVRP